MNIILFANTRTGSTCVGQWLADSLNVAYADEWIGANYLEVTKTFLNAEKLGNNVELIKQLLSKQRLEYENSSVMKILYHDFNLFNINPITYGPFSYLISELANQPFYFVHLIRQDLLAASISAWQAQKTGLFHRKIAQVPVQNKDMDIAITEADVVSILDDYEGRIISNWLAKLTLNYYFKDQLMLIDYDEFQSEEWRKQFLEKHFGVSTSAVLKFMPVGTKHEAIKALIPKDRIKEVQARVIQLVTNNPICV